MESGNGLTIRRVPLDTLHLDAANARSHDERNLGVIKRSLARSGQAEPLVVHHSSGRVLGGNGRPVAMRDLGSEERDVRLAPSDVHADSSGVERTRRSLPGEVPNSRLKARQKAASER